MSLDLENLKAFVRVAEVLSFTRAAEHLSALEKLGAEVESISVDRPSLEEVVGTELYS